MKWEKERHIKKNSTFHISVDEDIKRRKVGGESGFLKKRHISTKAKEFLCTC
jgi:hypothetical protein